MSPITRPDKTVPTFLIRELPPADRPAERLRRHGPGILTSAELLAVLLGTADGLALAQGLVLRTRLLTETGVATGLFRSAALPWSLTTGTVPEDGTLWARVGDTIRVLVEAGAEFVHRLDRFETLPGLPGQA